jgi:transcription initiation factor TFIIIB Brf1 subunit/transcription initiation factor TFIIB
MIEMNVAIGKFSSNVSQCNTNMQCDSCFSQGELDASLGHVVCTECGKVLEENSIVAELQFAEKSSGAAVAEGFTISLDQGLSMIIILMIK